MFKELNALIALAETSSSETRPALESFFQEALKAVGAPPDAARRAVPNVLPVSSAAAVLNELCLTTPGQDAVQTVQLFLAHDQGFGLSQVASLEALLLLGVFACQGSVSERLRRAFWTLDSQSRRVLTRQQVLAAVTPLLAAAAAAQTLKPTSPRGQHRQPSVNAKPVPISRELHDLLARVADHAYTECDPQHTNALTEDAFKSLVLSAASSLSRTVLELAAASTSTPPPRQAAPPLQPYASEPASMPAEYRGPMTGTVRRASFEPQLMSQGLSRRGGAAAASSLLNTPLHSAYTDADSQGGGGGLGQVDEEPDQDDAGSQAAESAKQRPKSRKNSVMFKLGALMRSRSKRYEAGEVEPGMESLVGGEAGEGDGASGGEEVGVGLQGFQLTTNQTFEFQQRAALGYEGGGVVHVGGARSGVGSPDDLVYPGMSHDVKGRSISGGVDERPGGEVMQEGVNPVLESPSMQASVIEHATPSTGGGSQGAGGRSMWGASFLGLARPSDSSKKGNKTPRSVTPGRSPLGTAGQPGQGSPAVVAASGPSGQVPDSLSSIQKALTRFRKKAVEGDSPLASNSVRRSMLFQPSASFNGRDASVQQAGGEYGAVDGALDMAARGGAYLAPAGSSGPLPAPLPVHRLYHLGPRPSEPGGMGLEAAALNAETALKAQVQAQRLVRISPSFVRPGRERSGRPVAPAVQVAPAGPAAAAPPAVGGLRASIQSGVQEAGLHIILGCSICLLSVIALGLADAALIIFIFKSHGFKLEESLGIVAAADLGVVIILILVLVVKQQLAARRARQAALGQGGGLVEGLVGQVLQPLRRVLGNLHSPHHHPSRSAGDHGRSELPPGEGGHDSHDSGEHQGGPTGLVRKLHTIWSAVGRMAGFDAAHHPHHPYPDHGQHDQEQGHTGVGGAGLEPTALQSVQTGYALHATSYPGPMQGGSGPASSIGTPFQNAQPDVVAAMPPGGLPGHYQPSVGLRLTGAEDGYRQLGGRQVFGPGPEEVVAPPRDISYAYQGYSHSQGGHPRQGGDGGAVQLVQSSSFGRGGVDARHAQLAGDMVRVSRTRSSAVGGGSAAQQAQQESLRQAWGI